jgi:hypothetical protein
MLTHWQQQQQQRDGRGEQTRLLPNSNPKWGTLNRNHTYAVLKRNVGHYFRWNVFVGVARLVVEFSPFGQFFYLGQFFILRAYLPRQVAPTIWASFIHRHAVSLTRDFLNFVRSLGANRQFFHRHIWSPWRLVTSPYFFLMLRDCYLCMYVFIPVLAEI